MNIPYIVIISGSIRTERLSHRVALFLKKYIAEKKNATTEIVDLKEYSFPIFEERLSIIREPSAQMLEFAGKIKNADGVIIVTPEYNGGYPSSIKNVVDLLYDEWYHKPVAITTVSNGAFGGSQVIMSLQFVLWKMHAWVVPFTFPNPNIAISYDEHGKPSDIEATEKRAIIFVDELFLCIQANNFLKSKST